MQESYDKRLNIFVYVVKKDSDNAWEKKNRTIEKFGEFLQNGFKIADPNDMEYVDIHWLPQRPVKIRGLAKLSFGQLSLNSSP